MADLVDIFNKINISTEHLQGNLIQEILQKAKFKNVSEHDEILWSKILDRIWQHLAETLKHIDDQLLCATCFYAVLSLTNKQEVYLEKVLLLINNEILLRQNSTKQTKHSSTSHVVPLIYGMFQSTFLTHINNENNTIVDILEATVELLAIIACEYSKYTFLAFKILNSFKKAVGTKYQDNVYCKTNVKKLINLVNHNWENPITGVRDLNKLIFKTLIDIIDKDFYDTILIEINSFYWNKAKYLMLAEIIENRGHDINVYVEKDWVDGIFYTLYKTGLVSAGADMYYAVIKNIQSDEKWCMLFLDRTVGILNGNLSKAIENLTNYWCLTTFKRFPQLLTIIINELLKYERTEMNLLSCLCILKQGARLGLINMKTENTEQCVLQGIEHENNLIRILSFEVISISQRKSLPTILEYKIVLSYLENNVNSDCTVLRISMLNNLKLFLEQLQGLSIKNKDLTVNEHLLQFYEKLQDFLVISLKSNGNYQRKVTTIKACNILLSSFINRPKKRQKSCNISENILQKPSLFKIVLFEEEFIKVVFGLLKDPADDVRENTIQLLLNHYSKNISLLLINNLIDDAQTYIKSKFFFQISCGQGIFRLIARLLMKKAYTGTVYQTIDDIFSSIFNELKTEHENKRNIVESIEVGKQAHSLLGIILEVLKVAKLNSYTIETLYIKLPDILKIIEDVSNEFTWDEGTCTSSDFSKMNDMIQNMITSSGLNPIDDNDYTKISGLQQIVLNCLWFNVKVSCDLASFLIQFLNDKQMLECEKCLTIVMHVLETSRHKGVIEAAGVALGRAIQYLTSLTDDNQLSKIPFSLLKCKLKDLISYTNMASITRRGAGLSIMVHRIVSSDMKKGKPLFHYFMDNILETCTRSTELVNNLDETQKDLPKAIYIHFLTKIVTDSSLASDMMYYSVELAEIAFSNLTSPHWQIRNAALQLYGALIPKLIGQKKASGTDDETVATVAFDEFRIHSPKLWEHMTQSLKYISEISNTVLAHSNTAPILNVLANLGKRYNFSFDSTTQEPFEKCLLQNLVLLLGSPIYTVRRLSAKSIFNIFNFETIFRTIMELAMDSENLLHGSLMLTVYCHKYYSIQHQDEFSDLIPKFITVFNTRKHSYVCKQLFEELLDIEDIKDIQYTLSELRENSHCTGISHWAKCRLRKYILHSPWDVGLKILAEVSTERDFDDYCQFVFLKVNSEAVSVEKYQALSSKLLTLKSISKSTMVWKILYHITSKVKLNGNLLPIDVIEHLKKNELPYAMRYAMPYLATIAECLKHEHLEKLANLIFTSCDPEKCDVDIRHIAALANNELAKAFSTIAASIKITSLKSAIILLLDEDEDVRSVSAHFYTNLSKNDSVLHPYISLNKILDYQFLIQIFANPTHDTSILCKELSSVLDTYTNSNIDKYNPFTSDSKNIYFEVEIVKRLVQNLWCSLK